MFKARKSFQSGKHSFTRSEGWESGDRIRRACSSGAEKGLRAGRACLPVRLISCPGPQETPGKLCLGVRKAFCHFYLFSFSS